MWENLLRIDIINITVGHLQRNDSKTKLCLLQGSTALVKKNNGGYLYIFYRKYRHLACCITCLGVVYGAMEDKHGAMALRESYTQYNTFNRHPLSHLI